MEHKFIISSALKILKPTLALFKSDETSQHRLLDINFFFPEMRNPNVQLWSSLITERMNDFWHMRAGQQ